MGDHRVAAWYSQNREEAAAAPLRGGFVTAPVDGIHPLPLGMPSPDVPSLMLASVRSASCDAQEEDCEVGVEETHDKFGASPFFDNTLWNAQYFAGVYERLKCTTSGHRLVPAADRLPLRAFACWRERGGVKVRGLNGDDGYERRRASDLFKHGPRLSTNEKGSSNLGGEEEQRADVNGDISAVAWHEPTLRHDAFIAALGTYAFAICCPGAGLDPNPKAFEALLLGTIPICM